jgi:hypothetical protein
MNEYFKNQKRLAESLFGAINASSEFDERPRDPMPTDEELNDMYEKSKGQSKSEAYRLAH